MTKQRIKKNISLNCFPFLDTSNYYFSISEFLQYSCKIIISWIYWQEINLILILISSIPVTSERKYFAKIIYKNAFNGLFKTFFSLNMKPPIYKEIGRLG